MAVTRGSYQEGIVMGWESLSGATLRGKARRWSGRYAASRRALLARMTAAHIPWREARGSHGRRVLVIGAGPVGSDAGATCV
jgi:hypothetical protein